jgi:hypothetical protein
MMDDEARIEDVPSDGDCMMDDEARIEDAVSSVPWDGEDEARIEAMVPNDHSCSHGYFEDFMYWGTVECSDADKQV